MTTTTIGVAAENASTVELADGIGEALAAGRPPAERTAFFLCESRPSNAPCGVDACAAIDAAQVRRIRAWGLPHARVMPGGVGRIGVLVEGSADPSMLRDTARALRSALSAPLRIGASEVAIDVRVAAQPLAADTAPAAVVGAAHAALRSSAGDEGVRVVLVKHPGDADALSCDRLRRDLDLAIERNELRVAYQPQVSLATGAIVGFEALLRWHHPQMGEIGPARFIPLAEETGAIEPLTTFVIERALRQVAAWERAGHQGLRVAINVSPGLMSGPLIEEVLGRELAATGVDASQVELELTESGALAADGETLQRMARLRRRGVAFAIDDFGTRYANLVNLSRLAVDCLKIDLDFARGALRSPSDAAICRMICELGQALRLRVLVEGIETPGQLRFFSTLGCHEAQGYLFSRPLSPEAATALLDAPPEFPVARGLLQYERHLLVLDDEENVLAALRRMLRRTGIHVHATTSPDEAFELLAEFPIGVVVSDQRMPSMSGTEFLRRVKDLHPATLRLVLSGYTDLQSVTDAINEGAIFRFLTKPWNDVQLQAHIAQAFEQFEMASELRRLQSELLALTRDAAASAGADAGPCGAPR